MYIEELLQDTEQTRYKNNRQPEIYVLYWKMMESLKSGEPDHHQMLSSEG